MLSRWDCRCPQPPTIVPAQNCTVQHQPPGSTACHGGHHQNSRVCLLAFNAFILSTVHLLPLQLSRCGWSAPCQQTRSSWRACSKTRSSPAVRCLVSAALGVGRSFCAGQPVVLWPAPAVHDWTTPAVHAWPGAGVLLCSGCCAWHALPTWLNTGPCTEPCCAVDSALIHYLLEHPEGGEMAFWAADRSSV